MDSIGSVVSAWANRKIAFLALQIQRIILSYIIDIFVPVKKYMVCYQNVVTAPAIHTKILSFFKSNNIFPESPHPTTTCSQSWRAPKLILQRFTVYPHLKTISEICFGNMVDTRCQMQYFHTEGPTVTLKIEPTSSKVDMSEILSMVTIYPNLTAIGEILLEINVLWT